MPLPAFCIHFAIPDAKTGSAPLRERLQNYGLFSFSHLQGKNIESESSGYSKLVKRRFELRKMRSRCIVKVAV